MRYSVRLRGVTSLAVLLTLTASTPSAQAETDSVVVSPGQLEVSPHSELQSRLVELESAYQNANVRKPRAGVVASAVLMMTAGVGVLLAGLAINNIGSPTEDSQRVGGALVGVGSATIVLSAGGLAFSGVRLKRAKRERRRLEPEIESLRSALDSGAEQR